MNLTRISVKMAWLLRHCQTPIYIQFKGGWADVKTIVSVLKQTFPEVSFDVVKQIVAEDEKGRYSFDKSGRRIRANQGHSIPGVVIEMESPEPPEYSPGCHRRFCQSILERNRFDSVADSQK